MTDEQVEAVAFAMWKVFARRVNRRRNETDDAAWRRRWRYVKEQVKEEFRAEARAAIETIEQITQQTTLFAKPTSI
jgi:hypothetical protein